MDFSSLPVIQLMREKLAYLSERQNVLAQNVANADTPGYRAQDVKKPDFARELQQETNRLGMTATQTGHVITPGNERDRFKTMRRAGTYETTPTGNNVVIQEEMMQMAQGQMEYQAVTNMYRKTLDLFRAALGRNS